MSGIALNKDTMKEVWDYLVANGFRAESSGRLKVYRFTKFPFQITITANYAFIAKDLSDEARDKDNYGDARHSISGVSRFEIFDWMLLFHITESLPLKDFLRAAKAKSINARQDILEALGISFIPVVS